MSTKPYIASYEQEPKSLLQTYAIYADFIFSATDDGDALELARAHANRLDGNHRLINLRAIELREVSTSINRTITTRHPVPDLEQRLKRANFTPIHYQSQL